MEIRSTSLDGIKIIKPDVHSDDRGYFKEIFKENEISDTSVGNFSVKQINQAFSNQKCIRGLHFQKTPYQQGKLIWVTLGTILDIVVDINPKSPNYKKYFTIELSNKNHLMILVPKGFAHGYLTLSNSAIVCYGVDELFSEEHDAGINFHDPDINLKLDYSLSEFYMSPKDKTLPFLKDIK